MKRASLLLCGLALNLISADITAAVSPEEAARLGQDLTPIGAERAGNAAGSIPAWSGGLTQIPDNYVEGKHHPDPFADDRPLFTIDHGNMADYAENLTEGQQTLMREAGGSWYMNVYPTRRSASFPDFILDATVKNATSAQIVSHGRGGVDNAHTGIPFPIPQDGLEAIFNHNLRWRGIYVERTNGVAPVTRKGFYQVVQQEEVFAFPYSFPGTSPIAEKYPNVAIALKSKYASPALRSGTGVLVLEPVNHDKEPRRLWQYSADLRRVFRHPNPSYDLPELESDGLRLRDEYDMFNGATDRFNWYLLGKREIYIPYNSYRLNSDQFSYDEILQHRHINPDLARYELHRVWVVRALRKVGASHVYAERVFYLDEDTWQIAYSEGFDDDGNIVRMNEAHIMNYYEVPVTWTAVEVTYDFKARRYLVSGLDNQRNVARFSNEGIPNEFSPNALNYYVR